MVDWQVIPTGICDLDYMLGGYDGGIYRGYVTEIRGDNFCGKTTLALRVLQVARDNAGSEFPGVYISTTDEIPNHLSPKDLDGIICLGMEDRLVEEYIRSIYHERPMCIVVDSPSTLNNSDLRQLMVTCSTAAHLGAAVIIVSDHSICRRDSFFSGYCATQLQIVHSESREGGGFKVTMMCRKNKFNVPGTLAEIVFPLEDNLTHGSNIAGASTRTAH